MLQKIIQTRQYLCLIFLIFVIFFTKKSGAITPEEVFKLQQNILTHFDVPQEIDSQAFFSEFQGIASKKQITSRLIYFDLDNTFSYFFSFTNGHDQLLNAYQDKGSKQVLDYYVRLIDQSNTTLIKNSFRDRLLKAKHNLLNKQLSGLKIALDPGHMGGNFWDEESGNFVRDNYGNQLSEGILTLQIALKLEEEFRKLGAETFITRRDFLPVTDVAYKNFEIKTNALNFFRESSLEKWFQLLISSNFKNDWDLYNAFTSHEKYQRIFSEQMRWQYFMLDEDLKARVMAINKFSPDITLIIHLDTETSMDYPNGINLKNINKTKAFVIGGFSKNEFASRDDRKQFGVHLLDSQSWNDSVELSQSVVNQLHIQLGLPLEKSRSGNSQNISPGVQARNLLLLRKLKPHPVSYLECLYYNNYTEFYSLLQNDQSMTINGNKYFFSNRLALVVNSIKDGVLDFIENYK